MGKIVWNLLVHYLLQVVYCCGEETQERERERRGVGGERGSSQETYFSRIVKQQQVKEKLEWVLTGKRSLVAKTINNNNCWEFLHALTS